MIPLLKQGLKEHPAHPALTDYLILAFLKTSQEERALKLMEETLEVRPDDTDLMRRMAELADRRGESDLAIRTYRTLLRRIPGEQDAVKALIRLLMERGRIRKPRANAKGP